ncbi:MAG TPA: galactose-1-phosphate uridylyltransferase [Egicoccus sp.]|nr:galactose-1-phosphate uridylyltransferase [Egicoccus sp.]HSK24692.1 galactose-1-phosphate uridylyltransferase [Egicoccus sp.]
MNSEQVPRTTLRHPDGRYLLLYGERGGDELPPLPVGDHPALHLRWNALDARWTAISPARNTRPQTAPTADSADAAPPACPLCPGGPEVPFAYEAAVFENRFPTLLADPPPAPSLDGVTAPSVGRCEVVLYTPTHTGSLATLEPRELARVIAIWADRSQALWASPDHRHVLVFENRGEGVGATLAHPHGQIYALGHVPLLVRNRIEALARHRAREGDCLSCDVVARDTASDRVLLDLPGFVVAVPFAPDWPYEIHVRAKRHGVRRMHDLDAAERRDLAIALRDVVGRYDRLFDEPMAYMMVCQQAPAADDGAPAQDWHLGFEFLPPNRAADRTKVRASVETSTGLFINDTVPETCAALLAQVRTDALDVADAFPAVTVVRD